MYPHLLKRNRKQHITTSVPAEKLQPQLVTRWNVMVTVIIKLPGIYFFVQYLKVRERKQKFRGFKLTSCSYIKLQQKQTACRRSCVSWRRKKSPDSLSENMLEGNNSLNVSEFRGCHKMHQFRRICSGC